MRNGLVFICQRLIPWGGVMALFILTGRPLRAALPPDFPGITVTALDTNAVAPGSIFLEVTDASTNTGHYVMMLDNTGTPVWYQNVTNSVYDFKVLPNGYLHYGNVFHNHSWTDGGDSAHQILDDSYNPVETVQALNSYVADSHDFQMLPNGHVLLVGYYKTPIDMSSYVAGGNSNGLLAGAIIQELDGNRNVVFQWRSWDHFTVTNYFPAATLTNGIATNAVIDAFHLDTVIMDTDGNLLVSNFGMDVWKVNRKTGEIMWRLGGPANQFSFVGVSAQQALGHFSGHALSRLDNGNILIYCNADQTATRTSKVYEYQLNETSKVATLVWSYTPPTNYYAWHYGSAQRLPNTNTFIGWGKADLAGTNQWIPACTEVAPDGRIVFELKFSDPKIVTYRAFRHVYPPSSQDNSSWYSGIEPGNYYPFDTTGVSMNTLDGGGGYNQLTVTREPYAPVYPQFTGSAPAVLPVRVFLTEWNLIYLHAYFFFDAASFGFSDPNNITVYNRAIGDSVFTPLPTAYNPGTGQVAMELTFDTDQEIVFGYPDVAIGTNAPILAAPENYRGAQPYEVIAPLPAAPGTNYFVNLQAPVSLAWSPEGLGANGYHVQIATNSSFSTLLLDAPGVVNSFYLWSNAIPGSVYHYRVNTSNDTGTSDWSVGVFQTLAGAPAITSLHRNPNGAWVLGWSGASAGVYVEFTSTLSATQWQSLAGPINGSAWTNTAPATSSGFYRLRVQ
jgi:hypothetical protein